jgi:hypothetical protein
MSLAPAALDRLTGVYRLKGSDVITVTRRGAVLFAALPHFGNLEVAPVSESEFVFVVDPLARISFHRDSKGSATSLILKSGRGPDEAAARELGAIPSATR